MSSITRTLFLLLFSASPLAAQSWDDKQRTSAITHQDDDSAHEPRVQVGVSAGSLSYEGGRREEALGIVARWIATPWFAVSVTPTMARVSDGTLNVPGTVGPVSGMLDLPIDATLSHGFDAPWSPGVALGLGVSLPTADTTRGFGAGAVGYSASGSFGFSPSERVWVHLGAGRSLSDVVIRSAFTSGNGWGDASAGLSITQRLSINGGYSTDIGAADSSVGHSTSLNGGFSVDLKGHTALNVSASRGLSGLAPRWSFVLGAGTAFPYLNHLGAGGAPIDQLLETFGGGTHGLGNGNGAGTAGGKGKGRSKI